MTETIGVGAPPATAAQTQQAQQMVPRTEVEAPRLVEAIGVHKSYDTGRARVDALNGVDLTVRRGEMVAMMGPSGGGKTTLLNCLSGLDAFDDGDIRIEGVSLRAMSDRRRTAYRARHMGFVFQFYNLLPVLTAVENVDAAGVVPRSAHRGGGDASSYWGSRNELADVVALAQRGLLEQDETAAPLEDVNEVFDRLEHGRVTGRLVLTP